MNNQVSVVLVSVYQYQCISISDISVYSGISVSYCSGIASYYGDTYIIITIVRSYSGKYHEFVAVCIVTSAQHE